MYFCRAPRKNGYWVASCVNKRRDRATYKTRFCSWYFIGDPSLIILEAIFIYATARER